MVLRTLIIAALALLGPIGATIASAAEIKVMSSAGFKAAYLALLADFEAKTGHKVANAWGPSMGETPQAVPNRLARGEPVDVVIGVKEALQTLAKMGKIDGQSLTDLATSRIGAAVKAGAPKPDISTVAAFKQTLATAKSIAYSDSASGVYIRDVLYPKLQVSDEIKARSRMIPADPVGEIVARGDAEIGFQQMSELKPVHGIELLGPIPEELQKVTVFSATLGNSPAERDAALALIKFLAAPAAAAAIRNAGMDPTSATQ